MIDRFYESCEEYYADLADRAQAEAEMAGEVLVDEDGSPGNG
jgi:hypothetical protein